ncbi:hypothetical protein HMPREF0971_01548 [Segatella oris F0302]|uniref:Uncharacterized protein n=1 Tax=Segatella oris F0302 TaxID=649760 RepID=D1QRE4_9BACT|nr:hypothetical protein HMPREF0971_01548 [Segatella oris F0302]
MASHKHGKYVFISIWWSRKVLKTRKKVDNKSKYFQLKTRCNFVGTRF